MAGQRGRPKGSGKPKAPEKANREPKQVRLTAEELTEKPEALLGLRMEVSRGLPPALP